MLTGVRLVGAADRARLRGVVPGEFGDHDTCVQREAPGPRAEAVGAAHDVGGGGGRGAPGGDGLGLNLREQVGAWIEVAGGVVVAGLVGDAARDAADDAIEDREEVGAGGRGQEREREAVVGGRGEDAVRDEEVEVDVEIDQAAKALNRLRQRALPHPRRRALPQSRRRRRCISP